MLNIKAPYLLITVWNTAVIEDYICLELNIEVVSTYCLGVKCIYAFDLHILRKMLVKAVPIEVTRGFYFNENYALCAALFSNRNAIRKSISFSLFDTETAWKKTVFSSWSLILSIFPYFGALLTYWCCSTELIINFITCLVSSLLVLHRRSHVMCQGHRA